MADSDSDGIMKSCFAPFSPVRRLLQWEILLLLGHKKQMGLTVDQEHPQTMHNAHCACAPPIIRPHPLIYIFFAEFHKKGPTGSEKQVINLVWSHQGSITIHPCTLCQNQWTAVSAIAQCVMHAYQDCMHALE